MYREKPYELFHLQDDPQEERDLAKSAAGKFEQLQQALETHNRQAAEVIWRRPSQRANP